MRRSTLAYAVCLGIALFVAAAARAQAPSASTGDLSEVQRLQKRAHALKARGRFQQALPLAKRATELLEKLRGPRDLELAFALHNLGSLYQEVGDYKRAEDSLQRALDMKVSLKGPNHESTISSLAELAPLLLGELHRLGSVDAAGSADAEEGSG